MRTSGLGPSSAPRLGGAGSDFTRGHSRGRCAPGPWHTGPLLCRDAQGKTHPDFTGVAAAAGREEGARPGPRTAGGRGNIPPPRSCRSRCQPFMPPCHVRRAETQQRGQDRNQTAPGHEGGQVAGECRDRRRLQRPPQAGAATLHGTPTPGGLPRLRPALRRPGV